jgi:hypothetical protein
MDYLAVDKVHMLLDPLSVPSLSALGLILLTDSEELEALEKSQISDLLPYLDSLFVHTALYALTEGKLLAGLSSRILVDVSAENLALISRRTSTISHLRILTNDPSSQEEVSNIRKISPFVRTEGHRLRSIYLDSSLKPLQSESTIVSREVETLVEECGRRNIEVIFEAQIADNNIDPCISEEFWRRQRDCRRKGEGRRDEK